MLKNEKFELISGLMDGNLKTEEEIEKAVSLLLSDVECQQKWEEYHIIRHLLRKTQPQQNQAYNLGIVKTSRGNKKRSKIVTYFLPLAATISVLGVGLTFFLDHYNQFNPNMNMLMSGLTNGNSRVISATLTKTYANSEGAYEVIDDDTYTQQQRSLENDFLRVHENFTNTGGIIRVSFPSENK